MITSHQRRIRSMMRLKDDDIVTATALFVTFALLIAVLLGQHRFDWIAHVYGG